MRPERLARTVIYESPWVNLYVDRVPFPNGRIVERHHLLDFQRATVVAFVENSEGAVLMVRVCRYTTGGDGWELPAGGVEVGEEPVEAVRREVLEETGYRTADPSLVYTYYPMDGLADKVAHVYRCRALERLGEADPDEVSQVRWFGQAEVGQMLQDGVITCGISLVPLLLCLA